MKLSREQRKRFAETGAALVPRAFPAARMVELSRQIDALVRAPEVSGGVWKYTDDEAMARGERILSRLEHFVPHQPALDALLRGPLRALAAQALGEPAVLFKDKINLKLPGSSGFLAHQDAQAGWTRYGPTHVTVMLSVDASTLENGCLELLAGPRLTGLAGSPWQPLDTGALGKGAFLPLVTEPGDVVLFDSYVVHRSAANRTREPRRVIYATYNPQAQGDCYAQYFADKHASYPPDIDRDPAFVYRYRV